MDFKPIPKHEWTYPAKIVRVVDGDTLIATLDRGMNDFSTLKLRLAGINTPEIIGESHEAGARARDYVLTWAAEAMKDPDEWPILVVTQKTDEYGRWVAVVYSKRGGHCLNENLIDRGLAEVWPKPKE